MAFKIWLKKFEGWETPRGDLARDVARDKNFPGEDDYNVILAHLRARGACKEAIQTFRRAWAAYQRESR
ncbi:MAG: sterile alpha motif-like domain-containing protein [Firmicutes bacterium]|nr:sterile alpha motif-like domain-containing protein [Bacillota bacterium]